ncbi:MAG: T9SS type A sorting domain-containing protein [Bacteroidetes bacterium]|nr:MAG: T9SS type A sorting domain-containing protein [Bacteroidota bacterium]
MKKLLFLLAICSLTGIRFVNAQNETKIRKLKVPHPVCYASENVEKSYIPPPREIFLKSGIEKKSDIIVSYSLFPENAKGAFEYAVSIWEHIIESDIPIYIEARWRTMDNNILGSAGPSDYYANFEHAPRKNRFYPISVVEKITKTEITGPGSPDIVATFNKETKWYFGTDGKTPELLYDFVTVVLHEIGHGLGFTGFFFVTGSVGGYGNENAGDAAAFDIMVMNDKNELLTDTNIFNMPSAGLYNAFVSNQLYSGSQAAIAGNAGNKARLYAPSTWNSGSSIYHLNESTYPSNTENSLMTHAIGKGEAVHDPGPITRGILADIGWKHMKIILDKPKDIEEKKPINFNLFIESDTETDSNAVILHFSTDGFKNNKDSLILDYNASSGQFSTTLNHAVESGRIDYYITALDKMKRTFSVPTEAPLELYSVKIGPDNEPPVISHKPIPYFISNGNDIIISANADDNLGLDSVYVEFSINDIQQQSFDLKLDSNTTYSGFFKTDVKLLNDGDIIKYRISATDSSKANNKTISPVNDFYSFRIEKIFEPVGGYYNDFNITSNDFVISDFDIYTEKGFENGSLHSPHPYRSPNKNNTTFNFTTLLKYPIIINENGTMSFDEIVLVEPGENLSKFGDDDFWDYVIVEGSKDNGKTWLPLANGYDSGANATWKINYNKNVVNQVSTTVGIPEWYVNREIQLLENGNFKANDTILIQFRLFSDPYANGWGWAIDNLRIQTPVSTQALVLSPGNIMVYPNPFSDVLNVNIQAKNQIDELTLEIFSLYGPKVASYQKQNIFGEIKIETNLSHLSNGMYLLIIRENGKQVLSKKIIRN